MLHSLEQNLGLVGENEWLDLTVGKSTVLFVSGLPFFSFFYKFICIYINKCGNAPFFRTKIRVGRRK